MSSPPRGTWDSIDRAIATDDDEGLFRSIDRAIATDDDEGLFRSIEELNRDGAIPPEGSGAWFWAPAVADLSPIITDLAKRKRYATIGEVVRRFGMECGSLSGLTNPEVDWAAAYPEMAGVLELPMGPHTNGLQVGEWTLNQLFQMKDPGVLAFRSHATSWVIYKVVEVELEPHTAKPIPWNKDYAIVQSLFLAAWAKCVRFPGWATYIKQLAIYGSLDTAVAIAQACDMGVDETAICNGILDWCRGAMRRHQVWNFEARIAQRLREDKNAITDETLCALARNLWLDLAAAAMHVRDGKASGDTAASLCRYPLQVLLWPAKLGCGGGWPAWIRFKKHVLRRFSRPDLRDALSGGKFPTDSDVAVRMFAAWNPLVPDGWQKLYTGKVVALLDLLRQMERSAKLSDLTADPRRSVSIRDFFLLVRDYL